MEKKGNWLLDNPVDYFNRVYAEEGIRALMEKNKSIVKSGTLGDYNDTSYHEGPAIRFLQDSLKFEILATTNLNIPKGELLSPFELLRRYKFDGNFTAAIYYVGLTYMDMDFNYIRVGIKYFKKTIMTDRYGVERADLTPWSKDELKEDLGKESVDLVQRYDRFVLEPDNINYKPVVAGNYNLYGKFIHRRKKYEQELQILWSMKLMKHIFGEQIELGLQYLKVLYLYPKQALPILVLVSEDRSTGKSTFVDWLSIIFGDNMVIINPQDMSSSFNESYGLKNIVAIEESRFDSVQTTEKLKALATQKTLNINAKYQNPYSIPFFGKLIITSNDEAKFSKVDSKEIRYWTRKIPTITEGNHKILDDLAAEIPYFLDYLVTEVPEIDFKRSRQVFTAEEIETEALMTVKRESRTGLHKDLIELFNEWMQNHDDIEILRFTPVDIKNKWFDRDSKISISYIRKTLINDMRLEPRDKPARYTPFFDYSPGVSSTRTGMYLTILNPYNLEKTDEEKEIAEPF